MEIEKIQQAAISLAGAGAPRAYVELLLNLIAGNGVRPGAFEIDISKALRVVELLEAKRVALVLGPHDGPTACYAIFGFGGFYCRASDVTDLGGPFWRAAECPLLILDHLGEEHIGDNAYSISQINRLIERRLSELLPTVICTALDPQQIKKRYGESTLDRLLQADAWPWPDVGEPSPFGARDNG